MDECKQSACRGREIASHAKKELEQETGERVVSENNFLGLGGRKTVRMKRINKSSHRQ